MSCRSWDEHLDLKRPLGNRRFVGELSDEIGERLHIPPALTELIQAKMG
jgi:hypothetical protein